jgi:hypothetical protein|tara:strand:+ start:762 stop:959 length:198 start_codon:yes stop_codon:yes gene_type:complete
MYRAENYTRDEESNALNNLDNSSLETYKASRVRNNQINTYIEKVDKLNEDVTEIKNMLKVLLNGS